MPLFKYSWKISNARLTRIASPSSSRNPRLLFSIDSRFSPQIAISQPFRNGSDGSIAGISGEDAHIAARLDLIAGIGWFSRWFFHRVGDFVIRPGWKLPAAGRVLVWTG